MENVPSYREFRREWYKTHTDKFDGKAELSRKGLGEGGSLAAYYKEYPQTHQELGWQPTCKCKDADKVPSLVLDPFAGSGTVGWVAKKLGRKAVGYEISEAYCQLALERNRQSSLP